MIIKDPAIGLPPCGIEEWENKGELEGGRYPSPKTIDISLVLIGIRKIGMIAMKAAPNCILSMNLHSIPAFLSS